jgi:hypothetical protein
MSWRNQAVQSFGIVSAFTELVKSLVNCLGLSEAQQIDVINNLETPDLPPNDIHVLEGEPFILFRNIGIRPGFIKRRCYRAIQMKNRIVVFQFKNSEIMALTKIPMEKTSNGMKLIGRQLLLRPIFAGTVQKPKE